MLSAQHLKMQMNDAEADDIASAREWFEEFDGPKGRSCEPETGCFSARIGLNIPSARGARGISIVVESYRESDTVLALYLIATGQT